MIAAHLALRFAEKLFLVKIAYDESFGRCSPGNVLIEHTIDNAFATDGIERVDCLKDMAWHGNWRMSQDAYRGVWVLPRRPLRAATVAIARGEDRARSSPLLARLRNRGPGLSGGAASLRRGGR